MYSETVMDHFRSPRNVGELADRTVRGISGRPEAGPYMVLDLKIETETITAARYRTYGCGPAIAAGSVLSELIIGKPIEEAAGITPAALLELLGGLPLSKRHCADIACGALRNALRKHETKE